MTHRRLIWVIAAGAIGFIIGATVVMVMWLNGIQRVLGLPA